MRILATLKETDANNYPVWEYDFNKRHYVTKGLKPLKKPLLFKSKRELKVGNQYFIEVDDVHPSQIKK